MFDEEIFQELCDLIENGQEVVTSAAIIAKKYHCSKARLLNWFYARRPDSKRSANFTLSDEEEEQLLFAAQSMSSLNMDWSAKQVKDAVLTMFEKEISMSTARRFIEHRKDAFSFKKPTPLGDKRLGVDLYQEAVNWANRFQCWVTKKNLPVTSFVNYDECRIVLTDDKVVSLRRLISKKKSKPQHRAKVKGTHCGTFLPFVSASGELLVSYFILSTKFDEKNEISRPLILPSSFSKTRNGPAAPKIFFSDTGYLNGEIWSLIMEDFANVWEQRHPGLHCCLIGDNLAIHRDLFVLKKALDKGIFLTFLVAGTTHWSQPLDNLIFACLKRKIHELASDLSELQMFTSECLFSLVDIVLRASNNTFTWKIVSKAFCETGLVPLNVAKIEELARLNHDPSNVAFVPTKREEYIVQKVIDGVQKHLNKVSEEVKGKSKRITKIQVRVKKNTMYLADDLIAQNRAQQEAKEKSRKEAEEAKRIMVEQRKRKREEEERRKAGNRQLRNERQVKKAKIAEEKSIRKEINMCKAGCGITCRKGPQWVGCSFCTLFWVCPICWKQQATKTQVAKHERLCRRKKNS
jgi:hypothetical protein